MTPADHLILWIKRIRRRGLLLSLQENMAESLFRAILVCAIVVGLNKLTDRPLAVLTLGEILIALVALAALTALARTLMKRWSLLDAAIYADRTLKLRDRIGSAYAVIANPPVDSDTAAALVLDAARRTEDIKPVQVIPYRWPGNSKKLAVAALALSFVWVLPSYPLGAKKGPPEGVQNLKKAGSELAKGSQDARQKIDAQSTDTLSLYKELSDLANRIERAELDRKEALKELNRLEDKINQRREQIGSVDLSKAQRALSQASHAFKQKAHGGDARRERMSAGLKDLGERLKSGNVGAKEMQDLKKALAQLAEDLKGLKDAEALSQAIADALQSKELTGEALTEIARQMEKLEALDRETDALRALEAQYKAGKQALCELVEGHGIPGKGKPGSLAGRGSTNRRGEKFKTTPQGALDRQSDTDRPLKTGTYERLYDAERLDQFGYESKLKGRLTGKGSNSFLYFKTSPGTEPVLTPYRDLYTRYAQNAEEPITKSKIPPDYRKYVRDYFDAINPEKQK